MCTLLTQTFCMVCNTQKLYLNDNQIGDTGMQAFATALAGGAMVQCQMLNLAMNKIGDAGMEAFAKACAGEAMAQCTYLNLGRNKIRDKGLEVLSGALATGAMPSLKKIVVGIKYPQLVAAWLHPQLVGGCQPRGIEIA